MAEKDEPETDEHGLVIQKHEAKVLVVLPDIDFGEQTLRYARSMLHGVAVGTTSVARRYDEMLEGSLQDEFMVDERLEGAKLEGYAGVLFVGGPGAIKLADDTEAQRLAREAAEAGLLVAAWGEAALILARAGVVRGKKVTGHPDVLGELKKAGGRVTGNQVERDGMIVTGEGESSGMRFGRLLVQTVGI